MKKNYKKIFLVTVPKKIVSIREKNQMLLGFWCFFNEELVCKKKQIKNIISSSRYNETKSKQSYIYCNHLYESILPVLGNHLNKIHKTNLNERSWRIILGPWLFFYISSSYERFMSLKYAISHYPKLNSCMLKKASYIVPNDTSHFFSLINDDFYNFQIYSKIFRFLGKDFREVELSPKNSPSNDYPFISKIICNFILRSFAKIFSNNCNSLFMQNIYLTLSNILYLIGCNIFNIFYVPFQSYLNVNFNNKFDDSKPIRRRYLKLGIKSKSKFSFENYISKTLINDIPYSFYEAFPDIKKISKHIYPKNTKTIFSLTAWHFDEPFKFWTAQMSQNGSTLLGGQHGGGYGYDLNHFFENHELKILDIFFSWGWYKKNTYAKIFPMPALKNTGKIKLNKTNCPNDKQILWAGTIAPRYFMSFPNFPSYAKVYHEYQVNFLTSLSPDVLKHIKFRPYSSDNFSGTYLKKIRNNVKIDNSRIFSNSLNSCLLFVCDHASTTFLEAFSLNKPTILFWNKEINQIRNEAAPYFDLLIQQEILFYCPVKAAKKINEIYNDVETWWAQENRQRALKLFCSQFVMYDKNGLNTWKNKLNEFL